MHYALYLHALSITPECQSGLLMYALFTCITPECQSGLLMYHIDGVTGNANARCGTQTNHGNLNCLLGGVVCNISYRSKSHWIMQCYIESKDPSTIFFG